MSTIPVAGAVPACDSFKPERDHTGCPTWNDVLVLSLASKLESSEHVKIVLIDMVKGSTPTSDE